MAEEVKLFGMWASAFNHTIEIALKLKGIQYQYIEEDLSNKSPLLLKYNPVPVLLHNEQPISESLVILEYIDETWQNNPILPKDPYDRAQARFWAKFIHERILPTAITTIKAEGKEQEQLIEEVHQQLKFLENELKEKDFFGEEKFPVLCKWMGRLLDMAVVNGSLPSRDKHIAYIRALLEASKSNSY